MSETSLTVLNFILGALGFIAIIGIMVGAPTGLILLLVSFLGDKKNAKKYRTLAFYFLGIPVGIIIFTLVTFAVLNTIILGS